MYVGVGGVDHVLAWFNRHGTSERILCLMLAGTVQDRILLERFFDERGTINLRLGSEVAFFLFSDNPQTASWIDDPSGPGKAIVLPAEIGAQPGQEPARHLSPPSTAWEPIPVDQVPAMARDDLVLRTQTETMKICEHFGLSPTMDLPSLLFLTKGNPEPFTIATFGAADFDVVLHLFDDIRGVAQLLKSEGLLNLPAIVASAEKLVSERDNLLNQQMRLNEEIRLARESAVSALEPYDLAMQLSELDAESARLAFDRLGLRRDASNHVDLAIRMRAQDALRDETVHRSVRQLVSKSKHYHTNSVKLCDLDDKIADLRAMDLSAAMSERKLQTVEDRIQEICDQYQRRFQRRRRMGPIKDFIRIVSGTARTARDLRSISGTIDRTVRALG